MLRFVSLSTLLVVSAIPVSAQVCVGTSSFANGMIQAAGSLSFQGDAKMYGASLSAGASKGIFATTQVARVDFKDVSEGATSFSGNVGYAIPVKSRAQFCPIVGYSHTRSDDIDDGLGSTYRIRSNAYHLGGAFGTSRPLSPTVDFAPFVHAGYIHEKMTIRELGSGSASASEDYGTIGGGIGLIFGKVFTLLPSVSVPIGVDDSDPVFALGFSINFGRRNP